MASNDTGLYKRCTCGQSKWKSCGHPYWATFRGIHRSLAKREEANAQQHARQHPTGEKYKERDVSSITVARVLLEEMRAEIRAGTFEVKPPEPPEGLKPKLACLALAQLYVEKHVKNSRDPKHPKMAGRALMFGREFGDRAVEDLVTLDIEDWLGDLAMPQVFAFSRQKQERERAAGTLNRIAQVAHHLIKWAIERGYVQMLHPYYNQYGKRIIEPLDEDNWRTRIVSVDEEALLLASATPVMQDRIIFALDTGLRRGEQQSLTIADLVVEPGWVRVQGCHAKSGKTRFVPLETERVKKVLKRARLYADSAEKPTDELVFGEASGDGKSELRRDSKRPVDFHAQWDYLRNAVGLGAVNGTKLDRYGKAVVRWHDLRATYATRLLERGVTLSEVRDLLGHSTTAVTERYDRIARENLKRSVAVLQTVAESVFTKVSQLQQGARDGVESQAA